jgi:hypothetical protein
MKKHRLPNRRAVSLTELLLVLSSCTLILSTSGVLLQRIMRIESTSRAFTNAERACTRLSRQFRRDVHQAAVAELDKGKLQDGVFLQLQLPGNQSVDYGRERGRVLRTAQKADKVVARDEFIIPPAATLTIKQVQSPDRIILSIAPPRIDAATNTDQQLQSYRTVPVGVQIEAILNRPVWTPTQTEQQQQP